MKILCCCALAALLLPAAASPAAATVDAHLDGDGTVGAALAFSRYAFPDGADAAVLGRADLFADSLSSGGAQAALDGPLLLTAPDSLDERVSAELDRLGARRVVLLGGQRALQPAVADALDDEGYTVERVSGASRLETATAVAARFHPSARRAVLARAFATGGDASQAFADSLGAGAYAVHEDVPVLLTESEELSDATRAYIEESAIAEVFVAGGRDAVADAVLAELRDLGLDVERVAGANRFETAAALAFAQYDAPVDLVVVDGAGRDAWASGFAAAALGDTRALFLTAGRDAPPATVASVLGIKAGVLCAPSTTAAACREVDAASESASFGSPQAPLAVLSGDRVVPAPGHPTATASFDLHATPYDDILCYSYSLDEALELTGADLRDGEAGTAGEVVLPLTTELSGLVAADCATGLAPPLVADIVANPSRYAVSLQTADYPDGALRGQLFVTSGITQAFLAGDAEVPGPGAPDGGGVAVVVGTQDPTELCAGLYVTLDAPATAAHIHRAPEGQAGEVVVELPTQDDGAVTACQRGLAPALVGDILANPAGYYVNVHTQAFPDGAIRGQLSAFEPFEVSRGR